MSLWWVRVGLDAQCCGGKVCGAATGHEQRRAGAQAWVGQKAGVMEAEPPPSVGPRAPGTEFSPPAPGTEQKGGEQLRGRRSGGVPFYMGETEAQGGLSFPEMVQEAVGKQAQPPGWQTAQ